MHTIEITPNLLFEYQCTNGKFIRLPNHVGFRAHVKIASRIVHNWSQNGVVVMTAAATAIPRRLVRPPTDQ